MDSTHNKRADELLRRASRLEDDGKIADAIKVYRRAAILGDPLAQSNLGSLLDDKISPKRPHEAVYWYKRALKSGYRSAAWNLAMHYKNLGKNRWYNYWLGVAAQLGDPDAKHAIRVMRNRE